MDKIWTLYYHKTPNNKYYVGITSQNVTRRWDGGSGYIRQVFHSAVKKYGWDNIQHAIIIENISEIDVKKLEQKLISHLKSNQREYGYNQSVGGEGGCGVIFTDERKEKLSISNTGEGNPFYGKVHSDDTKLKMSNSRKGKCTGINNIRSREIKCITTNEVFICGADASRKYNVALTSIVGCCRGRRKSAGTFNGVKLIWEYMEEGNTYGKDL